MSPPGRAIRQLLVVEDDEADVELIRRGLEHASARLTLHVVSDGEQALAFLRKKPPYEKAPRPDLVLLDLNLPKIDGREVLRQIKGEQALKSIPVVILTTSEAHKDIAQSYSMGANSYVSKPLSLDEFMIKLKAIESFWTDVVHLPPGH